MHCPDFVADALCVNHVTNCRCWKTMVQVVSIRTNCINKLLIGILLICQWMFLPPPQCEHHISVSQL